MMVGSVLVYHLHFVLIHHQFDLNDDTAVPIVSVDCREGVVAAAIHYQLIV